MFDVVNTSATARGFSIEDLTLQQAAGYFITAPSGFPLVGNEAEFIVERPGGDKNNPIDGLFPPANYVWSIWDLLPGANLLRNLLRPGRHQRWDLPHLHARRLG